MALQTIKGGGLLLPNHFGMIRGDILDNTGPIIDATGEKVGFVFQVPKTGTIDRVCFRVRDVTTSQTLRAGLETVDATTGAPTGTQYGGSAVGTQAAPVQQTFYEVTLGTAASATAGDTVALVVQFDSTVGNLRLGQIDGLSGGPRAGIPYINHYTTAWAKSQSGVPLMAIRYDDGSYENIGAMPFASRTDTAFNSGSTPDEIGNYFTLPGPMRAAGVFAIATPTGAFDIVFYEGSTALRTISVDPDVVGNAGAVEFFLRFSSPVSLTASTAYRIVFKPTTTTNISVRQLGVLSTAMLDVLPGGSDWYKTSRSDAGSWTEDNTARIWGLGILFDQIDDGASAGGGVGPRILTPVGGGGAYY